MKRKYYSVPSKKIVIGPFSFCRSLIHLFILLFSEVMRERKHNRGERGEIER